MKKLLLLFAVALMSLYGTAQAQSKGDMAVGINLGVAPCLEKGAKVNNFGIGAKFQYNVTTPIRLEADVDYWFKDKGMDVFDISANVQYLFHCLNGKLTFYPTVGIGYGHLRGGLGGEFDFDDFDDFDDYSSGYYAKGITRAWDDDDDDDYDDGFSTSANRFLFNVGVGAEYAFTSKISAGLEIKYQYMKDFSRLPITIGVSYRF